MNNDRLILLAQAGTATNILFHAINSTWPFCQVIIEEPEPKKKFIQRRIHRLGYTAVAGQLAFTMFQRLYLRPRSASRRRQIMADYKFSSDPIPKELITRVKSCNSQECRDLLSKINPSLILINGTRIISKRTIHSGGCALVNIHAGITPKYRGVHGGYWALRNKEPELCGVSLHVIDEGIDTGAVIDQAIITPSTRDSFLTYPLLQLGEGIRLLRAHLPCLLGGTIKTKPALTQQSALWYHPTLWSYLTHNVK